MDKIIAEVRQALKDNIDEKTASTGKRVFKEEIEMYGVRIPVVNKISKDFFERVEPLDKDKIFRLCEELWKSGYNEEHYVACNWSYWIRKRYEPADMDVFEKWLDKYVNNWASCDTLCNHTIGALVEMYPELVDRLLAWAHSDNRWVKRGAAVTLIIPARKGLFLEQIFEISDLLLTDKDDLVQKGYGWMLKAASEATPQSVFDYLQGKKSMMPRTALRCASEKLEPELQSQAREKQS